jgi:mannitol-specific phosphotransferase system IIBC component
MVEKAADQVRLIVFACEAGMGSSLIGANQLKKRVKDAGLDIQVIHSPVNEIPANADVVLAHQGLAERARKSAPNAVVLAFTNFLNNPTADKLVRQLQAGETITSDGAGS